MLDDEGGNLLMVHYNDLKTDLSGEMMRIAAFLEIETPASLWPELVEAATFEKMKTDGAALLPGIEMAVKGGHQTFLNKGTNGRWRHELTAEQIARLERHGRRIRTAAGQVLCEPGSDHRDLNVFALRKLYDQRNDAPVRQVSALQPLTDLNQHGFLN